VEVELWGMKDEGYWGSLVFGEVGSAGLDLIEDVLPKLGFAGVAMSGELAFDCVEGGQLDLVFRVSGKIGKDFARKGPAGPRTPFALLFPRRTETVGVVLKMDRGISEEAVAWSFGENADEGLVGKGPGFQDWLRAFKIRSPGPVQTQDCPSGQSLTPKVLSILKTGSVEFGATVVGLESIEIAPVHLPIRGRKLRNVD